MSGTYECAHCHQIVSKMMVHHCPALQKEPPCHSKPQDQWCDRWGPKGFMGHTCYPTQQDIIEEAFRTFETGATRDTDQGKLDFEAFLSPAVLQRYAEYMHTKRQMPDGSLRDGDNWQKGIPYDSYMKSMWRHLFAIWAGHRGVPTRPDDIVGYVDAEDLCGLLFNVMGYLHELLKEG